ncbi:MAG: nuclease-related domain-containing protein [Methylophaga sp.]
MDFSPIYQALTSLWYLIPLFILAAVVNSAWFKGISGEFIINVFARWKLDRNVYHLIKNVTLPTEDGTTQIDHIIVSVFGVFVVETKNLRGWIYGSPKQNMWTQKIYRNTYRFQNPLHQNYKHTKTLQTLLNL